MIIRYNDEFRTLEEQVFKNASDIEDILESVGILGIKVIKQVDSAEDVPDEDSQEFEDLEYGDAYAVGDSTVEHPSYEYWVKVATNSNNGDHWLNLGTIRGEAGPQGEKGDQGDEGYSLLITSAAITSSTNYISPSSITLPHTGYVIKVGDTIISSNNKSFAKITAVGSQIGVSYVASLKGDKGDKGDTGSKGDTGATGYSVLLTSLNITLSTTAVAYADIDLPTGYNVKAGDIIVSKVSGGYVRATSPSASATYVEYIGSLVGPKGDKGDTGAKGDTGSTGPAGQSIYYASSTETGATATILFSQISLPVGKTPVLGDLIMQANGYVYQVNLIHSDPPVAYVEAAFLADVIKNYTQGAGISIDDDVISVSVDNTNNDVVLSVEDGDLEANVSEDFKRGRYPEMTVGLSEQLESTVENVDLTPYTFRTTGGSIDVGTFEKLQKVIGGTIVWNQLAPGSAGATVTIPAGHVYYFAQTNWIEKVDVDTDIGCDASSVLIDLTKMVGKTLADFINEINTASPGVGVALVKALTRGIIGKMYDPGKLISVKTSAHKTIGFNQWDEQWEAGGIYTSNGQPYTSANRIRSKNFCPCVGDSKYRCTIGATGVTLYIYWYDINQQYIEGGAYTNTTVYSPIGASYFKIATGDGYTSYDSDICVNLSWSGYRDGEYEHYEEHEYPLDPNVELRGVIKLDDNNNPYYDGDEYLPDGTVIRKYGIVDLGTLSWMYRSAQGVFTLSSGRGFSKTNGTVICPMYVQYKGTIASMSDMEISTASSFNANDLIIKNTNYTDAAAFKTAMSGVYLVYELATPTTEEVSSYNETQRCNDFGTEMFVVDKFESIPVGHVTSYPANLRDKLQHLPSTVSEPGTYVISVDENGQMTLVPYPFTAINYPFESEE